MSRNHVWGSNRAAAANWFFRLGELGSVDRTLAANSSLLDDIEMVFRLVTTWVWSSLDCTKRKPSQSSRKMYSFQYQNNMFIFKINRNNDVIDLKNCSQFIWSIYLRLTGHVHSSLQEVAEVLAKLARCLGQVLRGATRRLHQLVGWLVEAGSCLVQIRLRFLEALPTSWELKSVRVSC